MASIVTVVIASQPGEGFVTSRWTTRWGATTLLGHVLDQARTWEVEPGLVILGADAEVVLDHVDVEPFSVLIDPEWAVGEAASLQAGLDFLQRDAEVDAVLLASGDMPVVPEGTVARLVAEHRSGAHPATVPKYRYAWGRPMILGRELWPRLLALDPSTSIEAVLTTHAKLVAEVWVDHLPPGAIRSPEDLEVLGPRR